MTAAEAELLAAAVEQRRAYRALDALPVRGAEELVSAWYTRMGPVRERWEKALVRQQQAADRVIDELKRTPIGLFSDTQRGREALEIHADALREATERQVGMRELHGHKVNECNDVVKIEVKDEPGAGARR